MIASIKNIIKIFPGRSRNGTRENNESFEKSELTCFSIYRYIKAFLPEIFLDEEAGCISFKRKTERNLTKFTITLKGDILSWSYNNSGLLNSAEGAALPEEKILWDVRDVFFRFHMSQVFEFYEEHEAVTWKHEIYKSN